MFACKSTTHARTFLCVDKGAPQSPNIYSLLIVFKPSLTESTFLSERDHLCDCCLPAVGLLASDANPQVCG